MLEKTPLGSIAIFDQNITHASPAGSCLLKMIPAIADKCSLHLFAARSDVPPGEHTRELRLPLPPGPVFVRDVLFTLFSTLRYAFAGLPESSFKIGTQGGFPFCDLSYAHCCHKLFLSRYRSYLGGGTVRRSARLLTHIWGALMEGLAFRLAKTIVVPSQGLARELALAYPKSTAGKIRVISNPVDAAAFARPVDFSANAIRGQFGIGPDDFVFSFCALGNFEWKGLPLAMEALAKLPHPRAHLLVIGGAGAELASVQKMAAKLGVTPYVHFTGFQKDVRPYFWSGDAFVLPSVYETFALVCLQAAAASLPLIVTPLYGAEEFAADGTTGWVVERETTALAQAMQAALTDRAATAAMGREASRRAAKYNVDRFRERWLSLINEQISKSAASPVFQ